MLPPQRCPQHGAAPSLHREGSAQPALSVCLFTRGCVQCYPTTSGLLMGPAEPGSGVPLLCAPEPTVLGDRLPSFESAGSRTGRLLIECCLTGSSVSTVVSELHHPPPAAPLLKRPQWLWPGQARARSLGRHAGLHVGAGAAAGSWVGSHTWPLPCCRRPADTVSAPCRLRVGSEQPVVRTIHTESHLMVLFSSLVRGCVRGCLSLAAQNSKQQRPRWEPSQAVCLRVPGCSPAARLPLAACLHRRGPAHLGWG